MRKGSERMATKRLFDILYYLVEKRKATAHDKLNTILRYPIE